MSAHIPPEGMTFHDLGLPEDTYKTLMLDMPYSLAVFLSFRPYNVLMMLKRHREQGYYKGIPFITLGELDKAGAAAMNDLFHIRSALWAHGLLLFGDSPKYWICKGCLERIQPKLLEQNIRFLCGACEKVVLTSAQFEEHMDVLSDRLLEKGAFKKRPAG